MAETAEYPFDEQEVVRVLRNRGRSRQRGLPTSIHPKHWKRALRYFEGCCAVCSQPLIAPDGSRATSLDHWIPLARGGGSTRNNILPMCQACNNDKGEQEPKAWLIECYGETEASQILERINRYFQSVK